MKQEKANYIAHRIIQIATQLDLDPILLTETMYEAFFPEEMKDVISAISTITEQK